VLPAVRLLEEYPRIGLILVDREQARFFVSRLGEVEELRGVTDEVHRRVREGGWQGREERRIERHIEDQLRRHLKHVAEAARQVFQEWPVTWLLAGGNPDLLADLRHCLHASLRDRWAREVPLVANASLEEIRRVLLAAERELQREHEEALLDNLYAEAHSGGYGVLGVPETLRALYLGEVQTLMVDAGLRLTGYRCGKCEALRHTGERCPFCGAATLRRVPHLVDEAIDEALGHGGVVEVVSDHEEFQRDGGMGGALRFRAQ
jgi:peptide chain release factor subunit 1